MSRTYCVHLQIMVCHFACLLLLINMHKLSINFLLQIYLSVKHKKMRNITTSLLQVPICARKIVKCYERKWNTNSLFKYIVKNDKSNCSAIISATSFVKINSVAFLIKHSGYVNIILLLISRKLL